MIQSPGISGIEWAIIEESLVHIMQVIGFVSVDNMREQGFYHISEGKMRVRTRRGRLWYY